MDGLPGLVLPSWRVAKETVHDHCLAMHSIEMPGRHALSATSKMRLCESEDPRVTQRVTPQIWTSAGYN